MTLLPFVDILEEVYGLYHRREFVAPDPLQFLYDFEDPQDREIVALLASSLAYGRVAQILRSVAAVLDAMDRQPRRFVANGTRGSMRKALAGFKHRFNTGEEVADLLCGVKSVLRRHGSLHRCLADSFSPRDDTVTEAMRALAAELHKGAGGTWNHLLCDVSRGLS
jgi:uncharacterized protein (TIGR02757 family)